MPPSAPSSPPPSIRQFRDYDEFAAYLSAELAQGVQLELDMQARYSTAEYTYVMPIFATGASLQSCGALHPIQEVVQRRIDDNPHPVLKLIKADVDQLLETIGQSKGIRAHYREWTHRYFTAKMGGNKAQVNQVGGNKRKRRGEGEAQNRAQRRAQNTAPASNSTRRQGGAIKHEREAVKKESTSTRDYIWLD
jgi:hypothetical protein